MICPSCNTENKPEQQNCKKCAAPLALISAWMPDWKWHARALAVILLILIAAYFAITGFLKPYLRNIPPEATPWLEKSKSQLEK